MKRKTEKKLDKGAKLIEHTKRPPQGTIATKKRGKVMHHQQNRPEHRQLFYYTASGGMKDLLSGASVQDYNVLYNIQIYL